MFIVITIKFKNEIIICDIYDTFDNSYSYINIFILNNFVWEKKKKKVIYKFLNIKL